MKAMTHAEIKSDLHLMVPSFAAKVAPVYRVLGWEWARLDQPAPLNVFVPTETDVAASLHGLIDHLDDDPDASVSAGGLVAYREGGEDPEYGLRFELSEFRLLPSMVPATDVGESPQLAGSQSVSSPDKGG
jgi:hypothetical protein